MSILLLSNEDVTVCGVSNWDFLSLYVGVSAHQWATLTHGHNLTYIVSFRLVESTDECAVVSPLRLVPEMWVTYLRLGRVV